MLNSTVQVSVVNQTAYLQPLKKKKEDRHQQGYFHTYYLNNQQKFLTYSQEYYQVKKLVEPYLKEKQKNTDRHRPNYFQEYEKNNSKRREYKKAWISTKRVEEKNSKCVKCVVYKFLSHTRSTKNIARNKRELFFYLTHHHSSVILTKKEEFVRRLDQKYLRLPTKNKIPQKKRWNWPGFEEWLTKNALLRKYQEWSIRGGKKLGDKYLSFLDLDLFKEDIALTLQTILGKYSNSLLNYLRCFHVETKKGYHVYLLTDELLPNQIIYHTDKFGKRRIIGSIQSKGKYVVGFDSKDKKLVAKGQWFWHVKDLDQVKETLGKFFIEVGDKEQANTEKQLFQLQQKLRNNQTKLRLIISTIKTNVLKQAKSLIQAKILSKYKTLLTDIWKVFYQDQKTHEKGYFLLNAYQKSYALPNLEVGNMRNVILAQGIKHQFFNRFQTNRYTI